VIILRVSTFNIQNFYLKDDDIDKYFNKLYKFIKLYNIDLIGMQEVVEELFNKFKYISGKPRMIINSKYNEYNPICSKYELISTKTYHLPVLNSFIPRIATVSIYNINGKRLRIINTHLALYKYHFVKHLEFNKLINIIKSDDVLTILMGDLNLRENSKDLALFINLMDSVNMKMVDNKDATYNNKILDFIFVSKSINYKNVKVISTCLSDHNMLMCDVDTY